MTKGPSNYTHLESRAASQVPHQCLPHVISCVVPELPSRHGQGDVQGFLVQDATLVKGAGESLQQGDSVVGVTIQEGVEQRGWTLE